MTACNLSHVDNILIWKCHLYIMNINLNSITVRKNKQKLRKEKKSFSMYYVITSQEKFVMYSVYIRCFYTTNKKSKTYKVSFLMGNSFSFYDFLILLLITIHLLNFIFFYPTIRSWDFHQPWVLLHNVC